MKSQNAKKLNLKISLDRKSVVQLAKSDKPPSSKCSQKTISSNGKTTASTKQLNFNFQDSLSTPNPSIISEGEKKSDQFEQDNSKLIQFLIQENIQLQKQNTDKDKIITKLLTTKKPVVMQRANTSNTERNIEPYRSLGSKQILSTEQKKLHENEKKSSSPLGFTFCNVDAPNQQDQGLVTAKSQKRFPKEFQIVPKQRRFYA